jgi:hypothetical protein
MDVAVGKGKGIPAKLVVNHKVSRTFTYTISFAADICDSAPASISKPEISHSRTVLLQLTKQSLELTGSALPSEL